MASKLELLLEAERRGMEIPADKRALLDEARARGLAPEAEFDFRAGEMVKNIPSSAGRFIRDTVYPLMHPLDTAEAVYRALSGGLEKLAPERPVQSPEEKTNAQYLDAVLNAIDERFGSVERFQRTVQEDPVGALGDVASVLSLGGATAARAPGTIGKVGKAAKKTAAAVDPLSIAANTGKAAIGAVAKTPAGKKAIRELYNRNAKWSTVAGDDQRARMTETALKEGISLDDEGIGKLARRKEQIGAVIDQLIDNAPDDATIPADIVINELRKSIKDAGGFRIDAPKDVARLTRLTEKFEDWINKNGLWDVSVRDLQDFKTSAYDNIDWKQPKGDAINSARKNAARAARQELETQVPGLAEANAQYGPLAELEPHLMRAAGRVGNNNLLSITPALYMAGGAGVAGDVGAAVGGGVSALQRQAADIALILERVRRRGLGEQMMRDASNRVPVSARSMLYQSGKLAQQPDESKIGIDTQLFRCK